jgi:hypothetical protein
MQVRACTTLPQVPAMVSFANFSRGLGVCEELNATGVCSNTIESTEKWSVPYLVWQMPGGQGPSGKLQTDRS